MMARSRMDPGWLRASVLPSGVSAKTPGSGSVNTPAPASVRSRRSSDGGCAPACSASTPAATGPAVMRSATPSTAAAYSAWESWNPASIWTIWTGGGTSWAADMWFLFLLSRVMSSGRSGYQADEGGGRSVGVCQEGGSDGRPLRQVDLVGRVEGGFWLDGQADGGHGRAQALLAGGVERRLAVPPVDVVAVRP